MTCPTENSLARLIDARLSPEERTLVERHLDGCRDCSELVGELVWLVAPASDAGRYRMHGEIARGGMGRVVEATDPVLGRVVAVKEVLSSDDEIVRRFARETRITARLEHPAIVPVYDAGTGADGTPYYVMRKVTGQPLGQLVVAARGVPERLALIPHVVASAHAMAHAHQRGILHRDLKPSNILVGDNGETVVIDWGLAKVIGEPDHHHRLADADPAGSLRTRLGTVMGTPGFIAPEQLRGDDADTRGDVYALGATLYYVLGRRPPHASGSEDDMMIAAASGPPVPIAKLVEGVPPELATIIDKALAFEAVDRYADASALADDLQRFLTGQLISAHRYSTRERLARFARRHRVAVAIAAIATVAIAIGSVLAIAGILHERDRADHQAALATEHAREAEQRADDLLALQADTLVKTNPTAAVALVKQLRSPPERWQRMWLVARGVAAGARSQGVAWALPAPSGLVAPSMSPSGERAAATSTTGEVWIYDLPHRTARRLAVVSPHRHVVFLDDDHVLAFDETQTRVVDLATGAAQPFADIAHAQQIEVTPESVISSTGTEVRRTDRATGETSLIAAAHGDFALAPDLGTIAVIGEHAVLVVELRSGVTHTLASTVQPMFIAWAADSEHLAVSAGARLGTATRHDAEIAWRGPSPVTPMQIPLFAGNQLYAGSNRLDLVGATGGLPVVGPLDLSAGMTRAFGDYVVVASNGMLHAIGGAWDIELAPPESVIHRTTSVPAGPFVIGAGGGRVFVWDLREVLPKGRVATPRHAAAVGAHDLVVWDDFAGATWIETSPWRARPSFQLQPSQIVDTSATAAISIGSMQTPSPAFVLTRDGVRQIEDDAVAAVFRGSDEIVVATRTGAVVLDDTAGKRTELFHRTGEVLSLAVRGRWVAAAYHGMMVRHDLDTGADSELHVSVRALAILADGRVCFPDERRVACWSFDATVATVTSVPEPVVKLGIVDGQLLISTASTIYDQQARPLLPIETDHSFAADAGLAVVAANFGRIDEVELRTGRRWQVVQSGTTKISALTLSLDATTMFGSVETSAGLELDAWNVELPRDAAATGRWLDQLTNATGEASALVWPRP